jgi:hypothetical protein
MWVEQSGEGALDLGCDQAKLALRMGCQRLGGGRRGVREGPGERGAGLLGGGGEELAEFLLEKSDSRRQTKAS